MAFQAGDKVGDYEVLAVLGTGGMGAVYQVKNALSGRIEAMKVAHDALAGNTELADRFLREVRVQASFDHPNIAKLYTAQQIDGQVLMFMEYVEGNSLDALMQRGPIPREWALNIAVQVLDALEYAHAREVIHRDIKPANIMVTGSGTVKLMDFGIAKMSADLKLTSTGTTLGSLYYMSPEQIHGSDNADARSDIYSLGVCLYEIVTGKRPFEGDSEFSLMSAHLNEQVRPPTELDPSIPEPLSQVILMSMAKDPGSRFQSALAMRNALNSVRQQLGIETPAPSPVAAAPAPAPRAAVTVAAPSTRSRRGIYIAIGSIATAALLVVALLVAPRYFGTRAAVPASMQSAPVAAEPAPAPAPAATPAEVKAVEPESPARPDPLVQTTPAPSSPIAHKPAYNAPASKPVETARKPTAAQPPPEPAHSADGAPSAAVAASRAELNEVREQYNQLAIRESSAKSGLQSLQNQMGGMGLRADMRETATRSEYLMHEAMASLQAGDAVNARRNLDLADRAIERLEKFLGR